MRKQSRFISIFIATIFVAAVVMSSGCGWWRGLWGSSPKPKPTANTTEAVPEKKAPPNQADGNTTEPLPGGQLPPPVPPEGGAPTSDMTGSLADDRNAGLGAPGTSPLSTGATSPPPSNIYEPTPRPSSSAMNTDYSTPDVGAPAPPSGNLAPPPNVIKEPPPPPPKSAPARTAQASAPKGSKALFEKRCSKCHELEKPLSLRLSKGEWATLVDSMKLKMFSGISDEEADIITDYLAATRGK